MSEELKLKDESSSYWAIRALEEMGANDIDRCTQETNFIYGHVVTMAHEINKLKSYNKRLTVICLIVFSLWLFV